MRILLFLLLIHLTQPLLALNELNVSIKKLTNRLKKETPVKRLNLRLELKKEHRMLDTLARLLASKLQFLSSSASYSVAWVKNKNGDWVLAVSINNNQYLEKYKVIQALTNIERKSRNVGKEAGGNLSDIIKKESTSLKKIIQDIAQCDNKNKLRKLKNRYYHIRNKVDLLKLYQSIKPGYKKYDEKIGRLFKNINNVELIGSMKKEHSEMAMATYILEKKSILGYLINAQGQKIPYQYIGNSMSTCGKCAAFIKGNKDIIGINNISDTDNMAIFVRGFNAYVFKRSKVPSFTCKINHKTSDDIEELLKILPEIKNLKPNQQFLAKGVEPSDSDE